MSNWKRLNEFGSIKDGALVVVAAKGKDNKPDYRLARYDAKRDHWIELNGSRFCGGYAVSIVGDCNII